MDSGSRRRRTRSDQPATSSPLKPKARPPTQPAEGDSEDDAAKEEVHEAPESEADHDSLEGENEAESAELQEQLVVLEACSQIVFAYKEWHN
jgi:hypothetical protein